MKINSIGRRSFLKMELIEIEKRYPSICFSVNIQNEGFSGLNSDVWIEWEILKNFIQETESIAYRDSISTSIVSMSPEEMKITIEKKNSESCMLKYQLSKYIVNHNERISLNGAFELGISQLEEIREFFLELGVVFNE